MDLLMGVLTVTGGPVVLAALVLCMALRNRRRGRRWNAGGGSLGVIDEIFRPDTHQVQQEQRIERELPAPAPAAGKPK